MPYEPKQTNERMVAQQGLFIVPSTNYETIHNILSMYDCSQEACKKIIIPSHMRLTGLKRLRNMNITSSSLFPGIDGFCRSLRLHVIETNTRLKPLR